MHVLPIAFGLSIAALAVWNWSGLGWPTRAAGGALSALV
jgi:hypothetical protein